MAFVVGQSAERAAARVPLRNKPRVWKGIMEHLDSAESRLLDATRSVRSAWQERGSLLLCHDEICEFTGSVAAVNNERAAIGRAAVIASLSARASHDRKPRLVAELVRALHGDRNEAAKRLGLAEDVVGMILSRYRKQQRIGLRS